MIILKLLLLLLSFKKNQLYLYEDINIHFFNMSENRIFLIKKYNLLFYFNITIHFLLKNIYF